MELQSMVVAGYGEEDELAFKFFLVTTYQAEGNLHSFGPNNCSKFITAVTVNIANITPSHLFRS